MSNILIEFIEGEISAGTAKEKISKQLLDYTTSSTFTEKTDLETAAELVKIIHQRMISIVDEIQSKKDG